MYRLVIEENQYDLFNNKVHVCRYQWVEEKADFTLVYHNSKYPFYDTWKIFIRLVSIG